MPNSFVSVRPDFARCRVLRHAWEVQGETEANGSKLIALRCTSCATVRYDRWNTRTGERWGKPSYVYALGYQGRGETSYDADWWRMTYAEYLYSTGVLEAQPAADTRKRKRA